MALALQARSRLRYPPALPFHPRPQPTSPQQQKQVTAPRTAAPPSPNTPLRGPAIRWRPRLARRRRRRPPPHTSSSAAGSGRPTAARLELPHGCLQQLALRLLLLLPLAHLCSRVEGGRVGAWRQVVAAVRPCWGPCRRSAADAWAAGEQPCVPRPSWATAAGAACRLAALWRRWRGAEAARARGGEAGRARKERTASTTAVAATAAEHAHRPEHHREPKRRREKHKPSPSGGGWGALQAPRA